MLAIELPVEVENRLEALARATGRTKSFYVHQAILDIWTIPRISTSRNNV